MTEYPATIARRVEHETEIKKSRFITRLEPVASVAEADETIAEVRKQRWDARHNCVAMITGTTGDQARSCDDGEPSGTAGIPMLEVLRRRNLTDVVAVVTRYFGGIKLGAGGLVRAYGGAVSAALDRAQLVRRRALTQARVSAPHGDAGRLDSLLRDWVSRHDSVLADAAYGSDVTFEVWVPEAELERLTADVAAWSAGVLTPEFGDMRVVDTPA